MTEEQANGGTATPGELAGALGAIAAELEAARTEIERQDLWRRARHALNEAGADSTQVDRAIGRRSVMALTRFVGELQSRGFEGTRAGAQGAAGHPVPGAVAGVRPNARFDAARAPDAGSDADSGAGTAASPEELKKALRAFKKRLKLMRLNEESKLGRSPMTSGKKSAIVAIMPPHGYPPEIWQALVAEGRLRHTGRGFYELADGGG